MGVNTVRFKFFKKDELKYLSHLDVLALMERALMRTGMPLLYSGGFHPKPKLSFSNPIPLGVQSLAEYCDIELLEEISAEDFTGLLNLKLPDNLKVTDAISFEKTSENKVPSLMSAIDIVIYEYELLLGKLSSGELVNKKLSGKITSEGEQLIKESLYFESSKSSFLKDFGKLFGPAGENEECKADLLKIKSSIHDYEVVTTQTAHANKVAAQTTTAAAVAAAHKPAGVAQTTAAAEIISVAEIAASRPQENIFFLKIYGYAKILKNSSNTIFKFNTFNEYFEKFLETADIEIRQVQKTGTYIFKDNFLTDPIEILSF
jgi:radical SAM-linked protein